MQAHIVDGANRQRGCTLISNTERCFTGIGSIGSMQTKEMCKYCGAAIKFQLDTKRSLQSKYNAHQQIDTKRYKQCLALQIDTQRAHTGI